MWRQPLLAFPAGEESQHKLWPALMRLPLWGRAGPLQATLRGAAGAFMTWSMLLQSFVSAQAIA